MAKCLACHNDFPSEKSLHGHIVRGEKISLPDYYHLYFPRKDLLTNEFINFKDTEQYFESFFNSKANLNYWFVENYKTDKAALIAKEILRFRAERKGLQYAPSQVELRTLNSPTIVGIQKMFNYNDFCKSLRLKTKYRYGIDNRIQETKELPILIDTREQTPFKFPKSKIAKLDVGDYTAAEPFYSDVFVERKSVQDFFGTFYNVDNFNRFQKEVTRAAAMGLYLIVVVEGTLTHCLEYKTIFVKDRNLNTHAFNNVRTAIQKFDNLQFAFAFNKFTAQQLTLSILSQGKQIKDMDIQYLIDTKQI